MPNDDNKGTRIHVNELRIGMRVSHLETLNGESPFMLDVIDIRTQADIQAIQKVCDYVFIDVQLQKQQHGYIPTRSSGASAQLSFARSFNQANQVFQQTSSLIKTVFDDIRFGNRLNTTAVKETVSKCVDAVLHQTDAMLLLTQLKNRDEYTAQHSMNVCVFSILLGRELRLSIGELNQLGVCGLMHDIGKMKVPLEILNKPGRLEDGEMVLMRRHTIYGRDLLMSARDLYAGAVDVAHSHHEKLDGTGYPRGYDRTGISTYTKIVAVVDAYDAITSDRVYQQGKPHIAALNILTNGMHTHFEASYVTHFINCIGFYPQGNLVELSSGEVALVVEQNPADRLKPKLLLMLDPDKKPMKNQILDLAKNPLTTDNKPYRVRQILRPQDYGIDLQKLHQDGAFTRSYPIID